MNVGSLFSGIGGIELGFEKHGFHAAWFVEYDDYAAAVLRKRWPNTPIYGDITKIDFRAVPRIDILTGGFPCQDISNAGKRAGISGSRSSLWKYYCEAIRILRPKYAVIENVAALSNRGLDVVLADLCKIGYDAEWYNLSASSVGALHRRERLFIIAYPMADTGNRNAQSCNASAQRSSKLFIGGRETKNTGFDSRLCICGGIEESRCATSGEFQGQQIQDVANTYTGEGAAQTLQAGRNTLEFSCAHISDTKRLRLERAREQGGVEEASRIPEAEGCESPAAPQEFSGAPGDGGRQGSEVAGYWSAEPELGRVAHGIPNRVDRIKCLGNAVVPQVAEVIAQAIKEYEEGET